jgi:hypothetical protein
LFLWIFRINQIRNILESALSYAYAPCNSPDVPKYVSRYEIFSALSIDLHAILKQWEYIEFGAKFADIILVFDKRTSSSRKSFYHVVPCIYGFFQCIGSYFGQLAPHLPVALRNSHLSLTYSSDKHGFSLHTLYRQALKNEGPSILIIADTMGGLFGCFAPATWKASLHPFGTGEAFLFRLSPIFGVYHWKGGHSAIMVASTNQLAMGTG